jgi:hypothetical protein
VCAATAKEFAGGIAEESAERSGVTASSRRPKDLPRIGSTDTVGASGLQRGTNEEGETTGDGSGSQREESRITGSTVTGEDSGTPRVEAPVGASADVDAVDLI